MCIIKSSHTIATYIHVVNNYIELAYCLSGGAWQFVNDVLYQYWLTVYYT